MPGTFLANDLWMTDGGELYALVNQPGPGLGAINWEKVGDFSTDIFDRIIELKKAGQKPNPTPVPFVQPSGVQVGGGLFGMDTTTLLLIALAAFLFMSQPKTK